MTYEVPNRFTIPLYVGMIELVFNWIVSQVKRKQCSGHMDHDRVVPVYNCEYPVGRKNSIRGASQ